MAETIFIVLAIVGVTATILALAALLADYFFPETPSQDRPTQRAQATYKRAPK